LRGEGFWLVISFFPNWEIGVDTLHTTNKLREGNFGNFYGLGFLGILVRTNIYSPSVFSFVGLVFLLVGYHREEKGKDMRTAQCFALSVLCSNRAIFAV